MIALSSAEAELYAILKGVSEALGYMSMSADWGRRLSCEAKADGSAALGIIARRGLGKLRHIDTTYLWLQQAQCHLTTSSSAKLLGQRIVRTLVPKR